MHDPPLAADLAEHAHQPRAEQDAALLLEQLGADDDVGQAGLVLQRDEQRALGGGRALAAGDQSGAASEHAVGRAGDVGRGEEA
ncbi:hypothetical protein [Thauera humireducens]|uniref:hypothetical protein n=1 Tax=Thauera humireducens TaxID=1134435 RepID=UPI00311DCAAB